MGALRPSCRGAGGETAQVLDVAQQFDELGPSRHIQTVVFVGIIDGTAKQSSIMSPKPPAGKTKPVGRTNVGAQP